MQHIILAQNFSVPHECSLPHLQRVPRHANNSLHEILRVIDWPLEDDYIAAPGCANRRKLHLRERHLGTVDELVHEKEITDEQGSFHAACRDLERLDEKRPDDEEQEKRDHDGTEPLPKECECSPPAPVGRVECGRTPLFVHHRQPPTSST